MTKDLKSDRWTCPNDRNLQLRSKLNAGWSIHTGKKTVKKDPQLTEAELIEIQKVLQRSEMLERNERERVMKLVDRLENMKRNANQAGCTPSPNRCALCGDYFCLLRTAPTQCSSCNKILCNKCCIDTECAVDSDLSSNPSQSRRNSSSSVSMTNSFINSSSNNAKVVVYLCRICSEQREFLKKSGAWFVKKFPNYLSDGTKCSSTSNISQIEKSNTISNQIKPCQFVSPMILKRNISTSSSNSSSFRFWKFKENAFNVNDTGDNFSDFSIDNDRNESVSNYDFNSFPTASRDNLISTTSKTPTSPTKQENFQFNNYQQHESETNKQLKSNNCPVPTSPNITNNNNKNNLNSRTNFSVETTPSVTSDKKNFHTKNPLNKTLSNNTTSVSNSNNHNGMNKVKDSYYLSDDDSSSPNMTSYKYYSNIISNLTTSPVNKNESNQLFPNASLNKEKALITNDKKDNNGINGLKNGYRSKNLSVSSITDEIFNNSLSVSASNLNLERNKNDYNHQIDIKTKPKCETSKLPRKNKNSEWCSTQLSMDDEKSDSMFEKSTFSTVRSKQLASSCTDNTGSSLSINGIRPKLSSQTVNNLAKKIYNQNSSITIGSVGNSSSAVSSASALTASLAKFNFK